MFKKVFISLIAVSMCSAVALAGPAPKASFDGYVKEVAQKTGKSEKEVRDEAIEALRKEGKVEAADLERIGRGEKVELGTAKEKAMVDLLKRSDSFQARTGLAALRNAEIKSKGEDAFDAMKENNAPAKKSEPTALEKDALLLGNIAKVVSPKAAEAIRSAGAQNYAAMKKIGTVLARRVKAGQLKAETVERLLTNAASSEKVLNGKIVLGENATEACLGMAKEAIENLDDFVEGGAREGKDAESYTKGMGKAAAEKFKQDLEEGIARVCALANGGCKLFSSAIEKACSQINGAKAI